MSTAKVTTPGGAYSVPMDAFRTLLRYRVHDELEESVYGLSPNAIYFDTYEELEAAGYEVLAIHGTRIEDDQVKP